VRKLVAAVLGTVATFVILFGLGMASWSVVALGVAVLVLAVGLIVVRTSGRAWVNGVAHVHSASDPPTAYTFGRCELQIVINAPGLPPRSRKVIEPRVPVEKWPDVGQSLPIKIAIDDQRHLRILWDEVPTHAEAAAMADLPPEFFDRDPLPDEVLIEEDPPPWASRRPEDDFPMPSAGKPVTADLTDDLGGRREEPVVVRQTPGGTIVLEGTLVNPPVAPLPRRPRPSPGPSGGAQPRTAAEPTQTATATAATRTATTPEDVPEEMAPPTTATGSVAAARESAPPDDLDLDLDDHGHGQRAELGHDGSGPDDDESILAGLLTAPADEDERGVTTAPADERAGGSGPIHGVGITLLVTDLDRSVAFYRDMLGFFEIDGGEGNAVLASGATRLVLRAIPDVARINRRVVHLNLEVNDVQAVYDQLKAQGVRFTYAPRAVNLGAKLELWAAAFRDPDGHGIALTQWRDRPTG
jgi:catechol 2,3-dioxygenase-like lactoylglutathione lyase family enzyme